MHFSADDLVLLCLFLLLGLVLAFVAVTAYTAWVLTHPYRRTYASALARGRPGDPSELNGPEGLGWQFSSWELAWNGRTLPVWDVVGMNPSGPVVVLSHGWGDSRIGALSRLSGVAAFASRAVLWDLPGHGEAQGSCSLGTLEVDALTALIERIGSPVVLYGWSLGAGVSIAAAARPANPSTPAVLGVIAEAPYCRPETPARNVLRSWGLPRGWTLASALALLGVRFGVGPRWRAFDRATLAAQLTVPVLVLHGEADDVCPLEDGRRIATGAKRGRLVAIPGAGHHGLWTDDRTAVLCRQAVGEFVAGLARDTTLNSAHAQQSHS
ncbi:MAG TPA: alpha/beta fold hydrolase [Phycisphaerales bacterium]|nr:alpha/beta fold hydrolase [Phycisphaerales bacterium]